MIFAQFSKTFCLYSYHKSFILWLKPEKCVTGRNKRLNLWSHLLTEETSWFSLIPTENDLCQILCVVLEFSRLIFVEYLAQTQQNNCDMFQVSKREQIGSMLTCTKLGK